MPAKAVLLQKMDVNYLRDFLVGVNNVPRYECLLKSDEALIRYASQKFSDAQLNKLFSHYILSRPASDIANQLREKNGREIARQFVEGLPVGEKSKLEFLANGRLCDIVVFNSDGSLVAIEVKANGDKIKPAVAQCKDYAAWADLVYLLIEEKKLPELEKVGLPNGVGLIVFDGRRFIEKKKAKKLEQPLEKLIDLMGTKTLSKLLGALRLKKSGTKVEMQKRVQEYTKSTEISRLIKESFFS